MTMKYICILLLCCLLLEHPASSLSLSCDWPKGSGKLTPLIVGKQAADETECRDLCTSESSFICAAINYKATGGTCELLTENEQTATAVDVEDWSYSVRPVCAGIWLPWRTVRAGNTQSFSSSTQTTLKDCMTSCLRGTSGDDECRSVVRSVTGSTCDLHSTTVTESTSDSDTLYFNRPAWYLESASSTSQAELAEMGSIADNFQIFYEKTLPVSGYLVGYQYYITTNTTRPRLCTSFVGLWRKVPQDKYKLIARTLLTPENPASGGVRFQFIQNETIRVEKGDVLSIFANKSDCNNLVSSAFSGGAAASIHIFSPNLTLLQEVDWSSSDTIKNVGRNPALKAFTSEYLSLTSAPLPHHSDSLTGGQIWISLPPPLTTEDSVVVAGYRVVCSTDSTLIQTVSCYNDLVSIDTREVLLTLPDVTKPYYTAVQVVRNFNGEEVVDKKYSPVSSLFCAGRNQTTDVSITEFKVTIDKSEVEINVTLLTTFTGDECAKNIKLNYTGDEREHDTGYRSTDDTIFTLLLDQGVTYNLKIYLMLEDEHEMLFWSSKHKIFAVSSIEPVTPTTNKESPADTVSSTEPSTPSASISGLTAGLGATAAVSIILNVVLILTVVRFRRKVSKEQETKSELAVFAGHYQPKGQLPATPTADTQTIPTADNQEAINYEIPVDSSTGHDLHTYDTIEPKYGPYENVR